MERLKADTLSKIEQKRQRSKANTLNYGRETEQRKRPKAKILDVYIAAVGEEGRYTKSGRVRSREFYLEA